MPSISRLYSRFALICCGVLLSLATLAGLCGAPTPACIAVMLTDGILALGWLAGAVALGSFTLRLFDVQANSTLHIATAGGLGLGIFSLLGLGLGLPGWLNRPVAIGLPALSIFIFLIDLLRRNPGRQLDRTAIARWLKEPAGISWLWLVPVVSLTIAAASASMMPGLLWRPDPHPYDVTGYHLLVPREWYEGGRIVPLSHNVFSYFPFNVEMQFLLLMHATGGPWAGMYACQFLCVGYAGLMVLAVYGAGARGKGEHPTINVQRPTSKSELSFVGRWTLDVERWTFAFPHLIAACLAATVPWFIMLAGVAYVESALMLYTALAIAWAVHAMRNPQHFIRLLVVAGIMAGFACGVKITAVPMLLLALPVALLLVLSIRRPADFTLKKVLIGCIALGIAGMIILSPWPIRTFFWTGNPLFPLAMQKLGQHHFSNEQVIRFTTAHSPTALQNSFTSKLKILWNDVLINWQYGFVLLPAGLLAFIVNWRKREAWLIGICGLFVLITWIGFTHLLPRFLVMLIPTAALLIGQIQWGRAWPAGILLVILAAVLSWSVLLPQWRKQTRLELIGVEDLKFMMPQELVDAHDRDPHLQIALIGDAQAFLYQIPMSQLHYRSVFDVASDKTDPIDAWIGPQVRGDPNWFLVVNPMEIARLHATYKYIPEWPDPIEAQSQQSFFLRGNELPRN